MIFYWINPCENAHWSIFTLHPRTIKESGGKIQADALIALKGIQPVAQITTEKK